MVKKLFWVASILLVISILGCSLKIEIDPSKLKRTETSQSEERT